MIDMNCVAQFANNEIGVILTKWLEISDGTLKPSGHPTMTTANILKQYD